ncbi:MAG TPA: hypothetical protein VGN23_04375 [Verrucomicrobiae bacterium]
MILLPQLARAVAPLTTDDADPVDYRQLQLNSGWQFNRAGSTDLNTYYFNLVIGITHREEMGVVFGYQWQDGGMDANGITDLTAETKIRLLGDGNDKFRLTARLDVKAPTASPAVRLGTGKPDADIFLIATYSRGKTSVDSDVGYIKADATHAVFNADRWFVGQTIRQQLNDTWTLVGEAYATIPNSDAGVPANLNFDGGVQYSVKQNIVLSLLAGSAVGRDSSEVTANFCLTWNFGPFGRR